MLRRVSVTGAIVIIAAVAVTLLARELVGVGGHASLTVTVAGRSAHVVEGTTLAGAAARFGLHPRAADVLDVNGQVLRAGAVTGSLLVDGRPASAETRLRSGDRITVLDGHDRREPLVRRVVRVIGGMANNPQFTVSRTRLSRGGKPRPGQAGAAARDDGRKPQLQPSRSTAIRAAAAAAPH